MKKFAWKMNLLLGIMVIGFYLAAGVAAVRAQSALDGFDPNANNPVRTIVVQPDGKILIGGDFTTIGGQPRNRIARLNADGTLDTAFNPNANSNILSIALQSDGKILVGGNFSTIGGQTRNRIARLNSDGTADSFNPNANNTVHSIVVQPDGKILASGVFTTIGGAMRFSIARINSDGTADSFNPNPNNTVFTIAVQPDGKVLAGGAFTNIGGAMRSSIARLNADGTADSFDPSSNFAVHSIMVQPDGKVLAGGVFTSIGGQTRNRIARLNADGTLDTAFNPNAGGTVLSIAVQSDGKILAGGDFFSISGQTRNRIARLDALTGAPDSFNPNSNFAVHAIAVQSDGKILAGGAFISIGGQTRNRIARLERDGKLDQTLLDLNTFGDYVAAIAVQPDGKILIGGDFYTVLGTRRNNIARLNTDGTLDTTFNPDAGGRVFSIAVQPDGKILVGGEFTSIGGQTRYRIARLDAVTGLVDSWNPNSGGFVSSIAVQPDGKILVGGGFGYIGGQLRPHIARLDAATGLADSWNPNASNTVYAIAVQADGKVLAGGAFISIGGQTRYRFARLSNDTPALSTLIVNSNAVELNRSGAGAQFTRVTFEQSTDNGATYAFLGDAAPQGSGFSLTGLNLPTGQNLLIRARGFHRSGNNNGSESITETVRNVFLAPAPDQTPPVITPNVSGTLGNNDWYTSDIQVSWSVVDAESPVADQSGCDTQTVTSDTSGVTFTCSATSGGGASMQSVTVKRDATAPTINFVSRTPAANANGWNNTDVTVNWSCDDAASGAVNPGDSQTVGTEGQNQSATGTCTDNAGNSASDTQSGINIDKTAPTISFDSRTTANVNGWNNTDVVVNWNCSDALSGSVSPGDSQTISAEGVNLSAAGTCTDNAGNTASDTQTGINIDKTAPVLNPTVSPNPVSLNGAATASPNATDALSGIASQSCGAVDTSTAGSHSVACTATDNAGNTANASANYQVVGNGFNFVGFFQPVDNLPTVNVVNAGQSIPIKFSLGGYFGLNIFAAGSPVSFQIGCASGAPLNNIEETVTAGGSSLTYDATTDRYSYVWRTDRAWRGTCRQLQVRLTDGSTYAANFQFR